MKKEMIFGSGIYEPNDEFITFLNSLGYSYLNNEAKSDKKVIDYVKKNGSTFKGYIVDTGKPNMNFKIGFSGFICIIEVDTEIDWTLHYDSTDIPYITYVDVFRNENGRLSLGTKEQVFPLKRENKI